MQLEREIDRWDARQTLPLRTRQRRCDLTPAAPLPAMAFDVWFLHVRVARRSDQDARTALVHEYESHARLLARRFYRHREPLDDLVQVALEALLLALDRFDPDRRMPFLGFANPTINGSLKRHFRDTGWSMRVPRRVHELSGAVRDASDLLHQDLGRPPSNAEIADLLAVPVSRVNEAVDATQVRALSSIDTPIGNGDGALASSTIGGPDPQLRMAENREALAQVVQLLDDSERELLERYFFEEMTQVEIAERLGVSQMQVSRALARILRRLRSHLPD